MEKERKTYDLLTSTCLKPGEIAESTGLSIQKCNAIIKRFKLSPEDFEVPVLE